MIVMKFGGSSVANRAQIDKVLAIVRGRTHRAPLVVCSAHKGITDALVSAAREAARRRLRSRARDRRARPPSPAGSGATTPSASAPFFAEITDSAPRHSPWCASSARRSLDYVSSFGERMSVRALADFFTRRGLPAQAFDVFDLGFVTDATFGAARPIPGWEASLRRLVAEKVPRGVVPVVTGFVGRTAAGEITTVGRNGSDLTATLVGAALGAEEVEIWSDTDGVMTADPSVVRAARSIPAMRFDEAAELAYFGSRVLHPSTLVPAMEHRIPVRVLNTNRPDHPGTVIHHDAAEGASSATSIAYKEGQIVATLTSTRMFGEAGFLGRVFATLGQHRVVVDMVATSEISVSFTTDRRALLDPALADLATLGECAVEGGKTLLVVVGRHLAGRAGLGAVILQAMA